MENETLMTLTADIVSAHVSNNSLGAEQVPVLIAAVYNALADAGSPPAVIEARPEPAVSIRASVKPGSIACLECGAKLKMLKRHLATDHNLSPIEYRARWGLSADYPMVAAEYSAKRKELAQKIGLGRKKAPANGRGRAKPPAAAAKR